LRGGDGDLDVIAHPTLTQQPVDDQRGLVGCGRALERPAEDRHDDPASVDRGQRRTHRGQRLGVVEVVRPRRLQPPPVAGRRP
jgi:hypothetical protein